MSLFKRAAVSEILSHMGVIFSTLIIIWLSVLLVRLVGDAANGSIGAEVVLGMALFSIVTALPVILAVSLFIAILTTVTRSYRESEMVVWFASGLSLRSWLSPILSCAVPIAILIAVFTFYASPWAYRQIAEYKQRFELRSDISKVSTGQFIETENGARVFFTEEPETEQAELGQVVARIIDPEWFSVITARQAQVEEADNGDRFLVLGEGHRYDMQEDTAAFRITDFSRYGVRLESKDDRSSDEYIRQQAAEQIKARPTSMLLAQPDELALAHIMWRSALPLAALVLAILAAPLGAVNPRLGKSGNMLTAGLLALLYMNLINLSRGWIAKGNLDFALGVWAVHGAFLLLACYLLWRTMRITPPKPI